MPPGDPESCGDHKGASFSQGVGEAAPRSSSCCIPSGIKHSTIQAPHGHNPLAVRSPTAYSTCSSPPHQQHHSHMHRGDPLWFSKHQHPYPSTTRTHHQSHIGCLQNGHSGIPCNPMTCSHCMWGPEDLTVTSMLWHCCCQLVVKPCGCSRCM